MRKRFYSTLHLRTLACWSLVLGMLVFSGVMRPAYLGAAPLPRTATSLDHGDAAPSCLGANDLLVSGGTVVLSGTEALDHLCVTKGGRIIGSGDLTLTVGALYVDASSAIIMDGRDGGIDTTHDCNAAGGGPDGRAGRSLVVSAYQATIEGSLSANGGKGIPNSLICSTLVHAGKGGAGGSIAVATRHLAVSGSLSAHGGAGGDATAPAYAEALGPSRKPSGDGGNGGRITLRGPVADLARVRGHPDDRAGGAGKPGNGGSGKPGRDGELQLVPLPEGGSAALPPEPVPLLDLAASAPAIHVVPASSTSSLPCGRGDLIVPAGTTRTLSGVQQFDHVCIGGTLRGTGILTLVARTIDVAPTGRISLDGRSPLPFLWSDAGRYAVGGTCAADHGAAHGGLRGPATGPGGSAPGISEIPDLTPRPGEGGGQLTLIAGTLAIDGQVRAGGGSGQDAFSVANVDGMETWTGSGGGSGGGITIYAHRLALYGRVAATGGAGGQGSGPGHADGLHGSGGCVKVFAGRIDAAQASLPVVGSAIVDAPDPADPVAPPVGSGRGVYIAATHHTLAEPFLGYWRGHGGLATLGYPATEAFYEHGVLQQYTERALLTAGGPVRTAGLGTALTAARRFPRVSGAGAGARFFADTGHSLGGRFLSYWLGHRGESVLGAPISEVLYEGNGDGSGRRYLLQWFERGRLEYHPENTGRYAMEPGLVGLDALRVRGWLPRPAPATAISPAAPAAGSVAGAKLYAVQANGDVFESDGSTAWRYRGGTTPDPTRCQPAGIAATADGSTVYVSSSAASVGGMDASGNCASLWRGIDGAMRPVPADELPQGSQGDTPGLLVAPDGRMIYTWTWATGLTRSGDGGASWSRVPLPGGHIGAVAIDPIRPGRLWLQMTNSGPPPGLRLYRSDDAGDSWHQTSTRGTPIAMQIQPVPMAADPLFSAALWMGTDHGLFHTVDGGSTWTRPGAGLPPTMPVDGLAVAAAGPHRILAWRQYIGVFSSADGGKTWLRSRRTFSIGYGCRATFDPLDSRRTYLACSTGVYTSGDGGRAWSRGPGIKSASMVLASTGHPGLAYLVGEDQQATSFFPRDHVFRTTDAGATWRPWAGGDMLASDTIVAIAGVVP